MRTVTFFAAGVAIAALLQSDGRAQTRRADVYVPSRPEYLVWGGFPIDKAAVAVVKPGQTVRIDTLSHAGSTQDEDPVAFFAKYGVKRDEILKDVLDFWAARPRLQLPGT